MAEALKNLGQLKPARFVLTSLYVVPNGKSAVVSSVVCCNQGATAGRFRVSHAVAGAADVDSQYLYYDELVAPHKTFVATIGITMASSDVLRVESDSGDMAFSAYGSEVT